MLFLKDQLRPAHGGGSVDLSLSSYHDRENHMPVRVLSVPLESKTVHLKNCGAIYLGKTHVPAQLDFYKCTHLCSRHLDPKGEHSHLFRVSVCSVH